MAVFVYNKLPRGRTSRNSFD